jgi:predicted transcriptional regulator
MPKNNDSDDLLDLTEKIVSSHVSNNSVASADLPDFIKAVYAALQNVSTAGEAAPTPKPAVPIKRSVTPNYIVCLEDGKKFKMLKRHLKTDHNMTPKEYRERWGLRTDYPMTAPNYAKARSELAKKIGLGRKPGKVKPKGKGKGAAKK